MVRNLIDNGNYADIIFSQALDQLTILSKSLHLVSTPLWGFTGYEVQPLTQTSLMVTFGVSTCYVTVVVNFVVIDSPFIYNTIIGRVTQYVIWVIASMYHLLLKFLTPFEIGVVNGVPTLSQETQQMATNLQSKQPLISTQTFKLVLEASSHHVEMYYSMDVGSVDYKYITKSIPFRNLDPQYELFE